LLFASNLHRSDFVSIYASSHSIQDPNAPYATKRNAKQWNKLQIDLKKVKEFATAASAGQDLHPLD
jgi:hypothetical protein